jgi:hypothetical protein
VSIVTLPTSYEVLASTILASSTPATLNMWKSLPTFSMRMDTVLVYLDLLSMQQPRPPLRAQAKAKKGITPNSCATTVTKRGTFSLIAARRRRMGQIRKGGEQLWQKGCQFTCPCT